MTQIVADDLGWSTTAVRGSTDAAAREWRTLRYFNFYRVILAGLLVALGVSGVIEGATTESRAGWFIGTSLVYAAFGVLCSFWIQWDSRRFDTMVVVQVFADIIAITTLTHFSGGVASGFGSLLVVTVAGGSILTGPRNAMLFAAIGTVSVLAQQIVASQVDAEAVNYSHAGILGAVLFATSWLANLLARRIRTSEELVAKRDVDLRSLAALNETIIQRMQSGILVVDSDDRIVLCNGAARSLLGLDVRVNGLGLQAVQPALFELYSRWREHSYRASYAFQTRSTQLELTASFAALGPVGRAGVLIFLEDASAMTQRAQQLKLASLGRLTASIAHEIRNPLGAISHAGQLLGESDGLTGPDKRLSQIIQDNCRRMNGIIEDVLELSRRQPAVRQDVQLREWLSRFVAEHNANARAGGTLTFSVEGKSALKAPFDPDQLRQVVSNLAENGLRHSGESAVVELRAGTAPETERPFLDVIDEGEGIAADDRDHVFEPFFTTRPTGTGLGLYIARELCEINQAALRLMDSPTGCRFRITFADPRRHGVTLGEVEVSDASG